MRIRSLVTPGQLYYLIHDHHQHFSQSEQKFLINMRVACDLDQTITEKQWAWLSALRRRAEIIEQMQREISG